MKKSILAVVALALVFTTSMAAFAAEVRPETEETPEVITNMDADTYLELRTQQIEDALEAGLITVEQAELLLAHIQEVVAEGTFGNGPFYGNKGEGNAECILGEGTNLGIFRSKSAGMRTGEGNGVGRRSQDGTGTGNQGQGRGQGNKGGSMGSGYNGDCILD